MKPNFRFRQNHLPPASVTVCVSLFLAAAAPSANAQTWTWAGLASGNWTNSSSWQEGLLESGPSTQIMFSSGVSGTSTQDYNDLLVGSINYDSSAPAYTILVNSSLQIGWMGLTNGSSHIQTIQVNAADLSFESTAGITGNLAINVVSDANLYFKDSASGGNASVDLQTATSGLDISNLTCGFTTLGSLAGSGTASLGGNRLTLGGNNQNTTFSGSLVDGGTGGGTGGSLTKIGTGTFTLTSSNSYTGGTKLNAGTLSFNAFSLGSSGLIDFTGNATLQWHDTNTQDISSLLKIDDGVTATVDTNGNSVTFASPLQTGSAHTGALTKTGAGTLTLTASNPYMGTTTVSGGTLQISGNGALTQTVGVQINSGVPATNPTLTVSGGATVTTTGNLTVGLSGTGALNISTGGSVTNQNGNVGSQAGATGAVTVDGAGSIWHNTYLGIGVGGNGALNITNGGKVTVSSDTSYAGFYSGSNGSVTVDGTDSQLSTAGDLVMGIGGTGTLNLVNGSVVTVGGGAGILQLAQNAGSSGTLNIGTGNGMGSGTLQAATVNGGAGTSSVNFNHSDSGVTFTPQITGNIAVNHLGSGTTVFNGPNSYTQGTVIHGGQLTVNDSQGLGTGPVTLTASDAGHPVGLNYGLNTSALQVGAVTLNGFTTIGLQNIGIQSTGVVTINGTGNTITLGGGAWNSATNTLLAGTSLQRGSGAAISLTGGVLETRMLGLGGSTIVGHTSYNFGYNANSLYLQTAAVQLALVWNGAANSQWDSSSANWQSSNGGLNPSGPNLAFVAGDSVYFPNATSSITVTGGAVQAGNLFVSNGTGTVTLGGGGIAAGNLTKTGAGALSLANDLTLTGTFQNAGSGAVTLSGTLAAAGVVQNGTGTLTLTGANTYTCATTIHAGTLSFAQGALDTTSTVDFTGNSKLQWNGNTQDLSNRMKIEDGVTATVDTNGNDVTFGSTLQTGTLQTAALAKTGAGTLTLSATNSFTGATTVSAGTLQLTGGGAITRTSGILIDSVAPAGSAALAVDGAASSSTTTGNVVVGQLGTGTMSVLNGGTVTDTGANGMAYIGHWANSSGSVTVGGAGSTWTTTATFLVGYEGCGNVNITDGGTLDTANSANGCEIGSMHGSIGTVTVDGAGSTWVTPRSIYIADWGCGTVMITHGGTMGNSNRPSQCDIGFQSGSNGTMTVDGAGSTYTTNLLRVGIIGTGTLNLLNGGLVTVGGSAGTGTLVLAHDVGSSGTLNIGNGAGAGTLQAATVNGGNGTAIVNFNHSGPSFTFAPQITGNIAVNQRGSGTTNLTGLNTFTGTTTVSAGILNLANQNAVQNSTVTMNGGSLVFDHSVSAEAFTLGGLAASSSGAGFDIALQDNAVAPNAVALSVGNNNANTTYAGILSGSGSLTKVGTGTLTLTAPNTYTQGTQISGGQLTVNHSHGLGTGPLTLTGSDANHQVTLSYGLGSSALQVGALTLNGFATIGLSSNSSIQSSGVVTINGTGNLITLGGGAWNSGTDTLVSGSTLGIGVGAAISLTGGILNSQTLGLGGTTIVGRTSYSFGSTANSLYLQTAAVQLDLVWTGAANNTWDTSSANWQASTGGLNPTGTNIAFVAADNVYFPNATSNITVTGGGVQAGNLFVSNETGTVTLGGGSIAAGTLTKTGAGTLALTGSNSYTGVITVSSGTLQVSGGGAISQTSGILIDSVAPATSAALTVDGTASSIASIGNIIVGQNGTGTLDLLNGGMSTVGAGTLVLAEYLGSFGTLNIGGTIAGVLDAATVIGGAGTAVVNFNHGDAITFEPQIAGSIAVNQLGSGTTKLAGGNSYTGVTTVSAGTLDLANQNAVQKSTVTMSGGRLVFDSSVSGGTFTLGGLAASSSGPGYDIALQDNAATPHAVTLSVGNNNTNTTYAGTLSGSGSLTRIGTGTLTLTGSNEHTGVTTVNAGTLNLANQNAVQNSTLTMNGGSLVFDSSVSGHAFTFGGLAASSSGPAYDIILQDNASSPIAVALSVGNNNGDTTYAGVLGGTGSLIKIGTGRLTLTGANTYGGVTTVTAGTLHISAGGALTQTASIGIDSVSPATSAALTIDGSTSIVTSLGDVIVGNSGTGTLNLRNGGAMTVNSGTGTVTLANDANSSGTLNIGAAVDAGTLTAAMVTGGAGTAFVNFNHNNSGYIFAPQLAGSLVVNQLGSGMTILTAANSHTGTTMVSGGTLDLSNQNAVQNSTVILTGGSLVFDSSVSGHAFTFGGLTAGFSGPGYDLALQDNAATTPNAVALSVGNNNATTTYGGVLSGTGSLVKIGTGMLTLIGANTYSGATTVAAGTLQIPARGSLTQTASIGIDSVPPATSATLTIDGNTSNVTSLGGVIVGNSGTGTLNLRNGAAMTVDSGTGTVTLANGTNSSGTLNIGAGEAAATLTAAMVTGGDGTAVVNFNHNDSGYIFAPQLAGSLVVNQLGSGTTILTAANSYTGTTTVSAGTLDLSNQNAVQNSTVMLSGGGLVFDSSVTGNAFTLGGLAASSSGPGYDLALQDNAATTPNAVTLSVGYNNTDTTYAGGDNWEFSG